MKYFGSFGEAHSHSGEPDFFAREGVPVEAPAPAYDEFASAMANSGGSNLLHPCVYPTEESSTTSVPPADQGSEAHSRRSASYKLSFSSASLGLDADDLHGMRRPSLSSRAARSGAPSGAHANQLGRSGSGGSAFNGGPHLMNTMPALHSPTSGSSAATALGGGAPRGLARASMDSNLVGGRRRSPRFSGGAPPSHLSLASSPTAGVSNGGTSCTGDRIERQIDAWNARWLRPDGFRCYYDSLQEPGDTTWLGTA